MQCLVRNEFSDAGLSAAAYTLLMEAFRCNPTYLNSECLYSEFDKSEILNAIKFKSIPRILMATRVVGSYSMEYIVNGATDIVNDIFNALMLEIRKTHKPGCLRRIVTGTLRIGAKPVESYGEEMAITLWLYFVTAKNKE